MELLFFLLSVGFISLSGVLMPGPVFAASVAMAIIIGVYRMFMVQSNVWITLLGVVIGGLVYGGLILKLDKKMHDEIQSIVEGMGFVWSSWL